MIIVMISYVSLINASTYAELIVLWSWTLSSYSFTTSHQQCNTARDVDTYFL